MSDSETDANRQRAPDTSQPGGSSYELINLGLEASLTELPTRISVSNRTYYLVRNETGYQILSASCPHQGGEVVDVGGCFECPLHGWTFEHASGRCLNVPDQRLPSIPVTVQDGYLVGEVPLHLARAIRQPKEIKRPAELTIQLHSHACLEIAHQGFSLLTDPWLDGPAFLGAWMHYPPLITDASRLNPNVIVISHEHSDHFHEPTLARFDRSIPIYVPDFPNRRLVERLAALGFANVHAMAFGETYELSDRFKVTCFEPQSLWNDAMVLIEVDGFRLLNLNDAGLNPRIAAQVAPVNVVASVFSPGASGYPLTWSHLEEAEKVDILERACQGMLGMLKQAVEMYGGEYLLPFASHFVLPHPSHRDFAHLMRRNTLDDVIRAFENSKVQVIDLLSGEAWDVSNERITRVWRDRERLYAPASLQRYVERRFNPREFEQHHPAAEGLTRAEVERCILRLNEVPEVAFCEDLTARIRATGDSPASADLDVSFEARAGRIEILAKSPPAPNLLIEIPAGILQRIVRENLSWDEAHIGYWCRFKRSPDVYHAGFWRLLQAPYFKKQADLGPGDREPTTADTVVGDLIEIYGKQAERILHRYGLYCGGCVYSTCDSLAVAARQHGVGEGQMSRLVQELNQFLSPGSGE